MKYIKVKWLDAADRNSVDITKVKTSREFMVLRESYGRLLISDKDGVVIATDVDEDNMAEITVIPTKMLLKIDTLK